MERYGHEEWKKQHSDGIFFFLVCFLVFLRGQVEGFSAGIIVKLILIQVELCHCASAERNAADGKCAIISQIHSG